MKAIMSFFVAMFFVTLGLGRDTTNKDKSPATIDAAVPASVLMLSQWPDVTSLSEKKRLSPASSVVIAPRKRAWDWILKVIDETWLPAANTEMMFIQKEFCDRDVARIAWNHNNYHIELSQTASIFLIKLEPRGTNNMGSDGNQRFEVARQLARQLFKREGRMLAQDTHGSFQAVVISKLNEKIEEYSFNIANMKQLPEDNVVIGHARTMRDEGIDTSASCEGGAARGVPPNENSREAWHYWFRNVNWWNDGYAVIFYFLKVDGPGTWIPSWVGEIDINWFHGPRDRLGRPISVQPAFEKSDNEGSSSHPPE